MRLIYLCSSLHFAGTPRPWGIGYDIGAYENISGNTAPPARPTNLAGTAISASQINLIWTDNINDETSFTVQRAITNTYCSHWLVYGWG